ncbi:hypothetical protein D3272_17990 [Lichenibacterium ramalinae]|uniref:BA14K family protein n=1 Tax=Lichenibacterium ramalinae TaxID=2316527 RepID=A0A4Q2R8V7_9HYPH|nr:hypothetical protein D3272_17990 [Lichenibacterium ramalinae]
MTLSRLVPALVLWGSLPAGAADLPFAPQGGGDRFGGYRGTGEVSGYGGGGGFRVARVPVRPAPLRYDIYGYPVLAAIPSPLAVGNGCPPALQPDYDAVGNFAGYSPLPMCR